MLPQIVVVVDECSICEDYFPEDTMIQTMNDNLCHGCYDEVIQNSIDTLDVPEEEE